MTGSGGGEQWGGTQWRFGSDAKECVDTKNSTGGQTVEFNVTAPGKPGDYDAGFTARGTANPCGGLTSAEKVLTKALTVTPPGTNPALPQRCGINVMLVLDESGSIGSNAENVRRASRAFLNALSGTASQVSIIDFSTNAARPVGYHVVTGEVQPDGTGATGTIGSDFEPYLRDDYRPNGWTNWEDAFHEVKVANDAKPVADLVVFITDGDPTARNTKNGTVTNLVEGEAEAMRNAAAEADRVKGQGSRVFALGVGAAVTTQGGNSARRLTAISGFNQYPNTQFRNADYTLVKQFDQLAQALREIVAELCGAGIYVTKYVDKGNGEFVEDEGWEITARVSVPGGFTWIRPQSTSGSASDRTDEFGHARFLWRPTQLTATSTVELVNETVKDGYSYVSGGCERRAVRRNRRRTIRAPSPPLATNVEVKPGEFLTCSVYNRINPGTITIEKDATPQSSQPFNFTGSLGSFTLVDDRADESVSRTFPGLTPGTHTVSELVPEDWELTGITCTPEGAGAITGTQVAITLAPEDAVTCAFNDRRTRPPVPPDPVVPPGPPEPPTSLEPAPPPTPRASTKLRVVKTMPRVARVGQRVGFRLTVTNVGSVAARRVRMVDLPPAAVALASLSSSTRARVVNGGAVWRLGRLAPGAKRTIRGSVLITAGTPGLKRNLAVATAVNAQLAADRADTRLRAAQRGQAPAVTG